MSELGAESFNILSADFVISAISVVKNYSTKKSVMATSLCSCYGALRDAIARFASRRWFCWLPG